MDFGSFGTASQASDERNKENPPKSKITIVSEQEFREELESFKSVFPIIISDVTEGLEEFEEARKWIVDSFIHNVSHGSKACCLDLILSYKMLVGKANCSSEKLFLARILSWCVQMFLTSFFMADDIMDGSVNRRKNVCWYLKEGVGMTAINDICFIDNSVYYIVKKYFSSCDIYTDILDVFIEVSRKFLVGQYLDMQSAQPKEKTDVRNFSFKKYTEMVTAKSTPIMVLTVELALYLAGYKKETVKHPKIQGIMRKLLLWFQEQNDFLDCFGDFAESGKNGNDIEKGKCTWLIITALKKASESQLKILEENYGVEGSNCAEKVVKVYKDLKLDEMYLELEEREYEEILEEAQQLSNEDTLSFLRPVIINIANNMHERKYACL